ncbi:MAG: hypothetical protein GX230_01685 [Lentisphaerae bacterium]|jgi:hypothetical protein|nr:hypothetical protein [Lentisphaerota bacterium]
MRKNRKHQVHGRLVSVPIVGLAVTALILFCGYMGIDNRCHSCGQLIRDLEKRLDSLEEERLREEAKWNAMKTPDELERRLLQHGINMVYARPEQVVRLPTLDTYIADGGTYKEREQTALKR